MLVWNVVFDHVIVVAGRSYIAAAGRAASASAGPFANMDDWMRPAATRGFWIATAAGGAVLLTGLAAVSGATRNARRSAERLALQERIARRSAESLGLHPKTNLARQEQPR